MTIFTCILLIFLLVCAIAASFSKNLLNTVLIFMSFSLIMSVIWILLESPDLAITEAAVGAGVTTILFFVTLKKIEAIIKSERLEKNETEGIVTETENVEIEVTERKEAESEKN